LHRGEATANEYQAETGPIAHLDVALRFLEFRDSKLPARGQPGR